MIHKKVRYAFVVIMGIGITMAEAEAGFGVCGYGKENIPSLSCSGPAMLKDTTVTGNANVAGPLRAESSLFESIQVAGVIDLKNSRVNGNVTLQGSLIAEHSYFEKNLKINSANIVLKSSIIKGDVIISSKKKTPILHLLCHSDIQGSVTFDGKPGIVKISDDSLIHGNINNGSTERVKVPC